MQRLKKVALFVLLIVLVYAGWAAFSELRLSALHSSKDLVRDEPVKVLVNGKERVFANAAVMKFHDAEEDRDRRFHWVGYLKDFEAALLLAAACGYAGGFVRYLMESKTTKPRHEKDPFIGMILALVLVAIGREAIEWTSDGNTHVKPEVILGASLIAGIGWEKTWKIIREKAGHRDERSPA